jgi:hypothetical protein
MADSNSAGLKFALVAQGDFMHSRYRYVSSLFLAAALLAPPGIMAGLGPQDQHEEHAREEHRYYDSEHRDYHHWDDGENRAYRHYLEERHRQYVDFDHANHSQQQAYRHWRHEHPDDN